MTPMKIVQFSRLPISLIQLNQTSSTPLTLDVQFQMTAPPSSVNDNHSIKIKNNSRMAIMLSGPSFRLTFVFSINSLILSGVPLTSFHLAIVIRNGKIV